MVSFGEKAKIKKTGNLNQGRSYVITTVRLKVIHSQYGDIHHRYSILDIELVDLQHKTFL